MRLFWIGLALLILGGGYLYTSATQSLPEPGLWEFRVEKPKVTAKGLSDEEKDNFRTGTLSQFGIEKLPAVRRECLSSKAIRELRNFRSEAVPEGFKAGECVRVDAAGQSSIGASGQCKRSDGSLELAFDVSSKTASDRLTVDVKLDYAFDGNDRQGTAGMMLRIEGRRVGTCDAGSDQSIADFIPS